MKISKEIGLSFDDVLLVPNKNIFGSRSNISLRTKLTRNIELNTPIVSANMDTITSSQMAIAMAESGGIGIIHRFNTIQEEMEEVEKVKRKSSFIIKNPYTIAIDKTVGDVKNLINKTGVSGFPVVDIRNKTKLLGIVTLRDIKFQSDNNKISDIMTPKKDLITILSNKNLNATFFLDMFKKYKFEKIPIIDSKFNLIALVAAKDIFDIRNNITSKNKDGKLMVGAAVGIKSDAIERIEKLYDAEADAVVIDIAHGHSIQAINLIQKIKKDFDIDIIAGNVATKQGTLDLIKAGADAIKVGIGPGHVCTTRLVTGAGVPQLTAISWAYSIAKDYDVPIIADGGINNSGDIVKALASGASSVMIGKLFAGTDETPGSTIIKNGKKYKFYRGMSSISANSKKLSVDMSGEISIDTIGEGKESFVPYVGSVKEIIVQLVGGIKSGFSYCGSKNLEQLRRNAEFIILSKGAQKESFVR
ncbi:MAG: IMP dehydrogenase [Candidatus Micrarchaeaceae archaeon]